ncbi:heme ABC transporter permease CcmC [Candidatus Endowatersipora endosymbiont of Watersipora subatra]|uniref:heme ABC transporter permease CcmC n=1 Tax=Candidatus Endowatersipora endosymbiont of Watersipora subatra TaxID=3077946 RepID=UPI00312C87EE
MTEIISKPKGFLTLAQPARFLRLISIALPYLIALTCLILTVGLWMIFSVPDDYQQGRIVRIMYVHVPSVWIALSAYIVMIFGSLGIVIWRHPLADVAARSAAPIGAVFTFLGLITGSIWGRPMWGTYWVWDARLTSFLILLIIYLSLITLWSSYEEPVKAAHMAAIVVLVGSVNLVIIRFSVEWFTTLHQGPSIVRAGGPSLDPAFLWPLLVMGLGFLSLFITLHFMIMRNEIMRRHIRTLQRKKAMGQVFIPDKSS